MKKNTLRTLWLSLTVMLIFCIVVFTGLANYTVTQSDRAIGEVGEIYMDQMGTQVKMHFTTMIELQESRMNGIIWSTPQQSAAEDPEQAWAHLASMASQTGFHFLSLYSAGGACDTIFGEPVEIGDPTSFMDSLAQGELHVTDGTLPSGERLLLLGARAVYPMRSGGTSSILVVGLPMEAITKELSLDIGVTQAYSHIIRRDGSFVLRQADATRDSYFERLLTLGHFDNGTPTEAVAAIQKAISSGEDYSLLVEINGERRNTYFTPLTYSDWYLVSALPYSLLYEPTYSLVNQSVLSTLLGCGLVLLVLLTLFFFYFRFSKRQMIALAEARAAAEHANRAKSEFLSNMSHDIRTPMNAIVGMTAIASSNINNPEQVRDCLKKITLSSKHLLGLINDVLDMSKIESGKLTLNLDQISLRETMDSIVSIIQPQLKAKQQSFDVFIQDIQSELVCCDGVRLNQILLNLLSNALKFTPSGGRITVTLMQETSPADPHLVRNHFRVKDTGIGMSPEFQQRIFDSFTREDTTRVQKIEGTGLGMAITKYIVDEMGGTIELQSQVDKGTEFHITLDLEAVSDQEADMVLPNWEVLVVDDDAQLCSSAAASLTEIGVHAECALGGPSAISMVERRHQKRRDYHVVLLDWQMPGMDGIETARALRRRVGKDIPILLISAYDWSDIAEEARAAGISGFLSKPLFKSTLFYGLSRFAEPASAKADAAPKLAPDFTGRHLLLAEDSALNWEIARDLLSSYGFALDWAENGRLCVERFQASQADHYDAILMDIRMPVMDGYQAARAIRAMDRPDAREIPIIAMTADAFSEDIRRAMDSGMSAHIAKPIDIRELLRVLQRCLS
ncbi:response regulator [Intestinimonas butyriciproducens]|uniref:response regulator n=1 Tax=Intestinimonas butyriciproducens TaxID=1297617 RepID=UPI0018AB0CFB|nr:response regulator [Intestinimonas butyriciproducens]MDB7818094.1 response regulator [Intestinimonas butyriciproducens]MDB7844519.1 response regulator [Intestinimonas butyriciproducens]MDB7858999.1 response regulator [Intestinimonas butyriciproducens]